MIDPFVILTPILVLAVIGLLRFVGCDLVFPLNPPDPVTVNFDPPPTLNPRDPLPVPYKNLNFSNVWFWLDPATGGGPANGVALNGPAVPAGDISFANGSRFLQKIRVFPKRVTTVTVTDGTNPQISVTYQAADINTVHFINTADFGWNTRTLAFTIGTDIGFDLIVDTIVYEGPP